VIEGEDLALRPVPDFIAELKQEKGSGVICLDNRLAIVFNN
jgi:hypothetical protein